MSPGATSSLRVWDHGRCQLEKAEVVEEQARWSRKGLLGMEFDLEFSTYAKWCLNAGDAERKHRLHYIMLMRMIQGRVSMARQKPCRSRAGQSVDDCWNREGIKLQKREVQDAGTAWVPTKWCLGRWKIKVCMQNIVMVFLFSFHLKRDYTRQAFEYFRNWIKNKFATWGY